MKKILGFICTVLLSVSCFVFPMEKKSFNKRISELASVDGEEKNQKTLRIFASLFYYIECLCEVVTSEKIASEKYKLDVEEFDYEVRDLVSAINKLLMELDETDRLLFMQFDNHFGIIGQKFNLKNLLSFIEPRRAFAAKNLTFMTSFIDFYDFVSELHGNGGSICKEFYNLLAGCNAVDMKTKCLPALGKYIFLDAFIMTKNMVFYDELIGAIKKGRKTINLCSSCHKVMSEPKRCARCKSAFYCSGECQKDHWEKHKQVCKKPLNNGDGVHKKLMNHLKKVTDAYCELKALYKIMVVKHNEISTKFISWCEGAREFKLAMSQLYKKIYPLIKKKKVLVGYRRFRVLPSRIFVLNELICSNDTKSLKIFSNALKIICDYCNRVFLYKMGCFVISTFAVETLERKRDLLLRRVRNHKLIFDGIKRLFNFEVFYSKNKLTLLVPVLNYSLSHDFISPTIHISEIFMYYKEFVDAGLKGLKRKKLSLTGISKVLSDLERYLYGAGNTVAQLDENLCIRQTLGSLDQESMSCVLFKEYKKLHAIKDLLFTPVVVGGFTLTDKCNNFPLFIDEAVKKGFGKLVRVGKQLPECLKSLSVDFSQNFVIIIKGKLATTKQYFDKLMDKSVKLSHSGFIGGVGYAFQVLDGYFVYVFNKNKKLVKRFFQPEEKLEKKK